MLSPKRHVLIALLFILKCFTKYFVIGRSNNNNNNNNDNDYDNDCEYGYADDYDYSYNRSVFASSF